MTDTSGGGPAPEAPGYWQQASVQPQPGYHGYPYAPAPPIHPFAKTSLVLGVTSIVTALVTLGTIALALLLCAMFAPYF